MSSDLNNNSRMECSIHGIQKPAFVCRHLLTGSGLGFFQPEESIEEHDVENDWCRQCEDVAIREGGWTDISEEFAQITAVCEGCLEAIKSRNI